LRSRGAGPAQTNIPSGESVDPPIKNEFLGGLGTNTAYPQIAWSNSVDKSGFSSWIKRFGYWLFSAQFWRLVEHPFAVARRGSRGRIRSR
jgi:hypothetical protein